MAGIQHKPVGVFWDIENCSIPKAKSPSDIIAHIRNFFVFNRLNHREFEFIISCDVTRLRKDIPEDINKAGGVTLAHVNGNSKNAADEKLRENMKKFVDTHVSSVRPILILISGDIDFVNDLRGYQTRLGCTIILIHAPNCSAQFKIGWNETYCFTNFCSAVKDNPAVNKQLGPHPNQKYQGGAPNQKSQGGPPNPKYQGGAPNQRTQGGQPEARNRHNGQTTQGQRERNPGNRNSNFINGPSASNGSQQHLNHSGNNPSLRYPPSSGNNPANIAAEKQPAKETFILMVGGLPGKMDFKILKENLQLQANKVQGKVKYVKNGQAFITFRNKTNADRAVELFNGKKVFGKTLNVSFTKSIPFEDQADIKPKSGSEAFVMVEQAGGSTGGSKQSKNKDGNNKPSASNGGSSSGLSNDPVLAGLGSIIGGFMAHRISAAKPAGEKSSDLCPIQ